MNNHLTIYGAPKSRAIRVYWMAEEIGVHYESIPIAYADCAHSTVIAAVNPNRRVPAIEDNGFGMFESMAINLYLARKHSPSLLPHDLRTEAEVLRWSFWAATEMDDALTTLALETVIRPEDERDQEVAARARPVFHSKLQILESALEGRSYLCNQDFTVGDLNLASTMYWALFLDISHAPRSEEWLHRCWARDAAVRARKLRE